MAVAALTGAMPNSQPTRSRLPCGGSGGSARVKASGRIASAIAMMGSLIITQISDRAAAASLGFLLGITMPTLYVMCSAHANDRAGPNFTVEVSSSVLFLYCAGAFIGPVIAAILMERFGANALYWHNAGIYGLMLVYVVIRVRMRPPPVQRPEEELEPSRLK
ncbi:MAG: MFS transporter [Beijerinckiaceae bacterium]